MALAFHSESAIVMWYLSLCGYAALHEYQLIAELQEQRRLKRYIIETYGEYLPDNLPNSANIAQPLIGDIRRQDIDIQMAQNILRQAFSAYQNWEAETLRNNEQIAAQLHANGCIADYQYVMHIITDVQEELRILNNLIIELQAHGWDMPQIVAAQVDTRNHYAKQLKKPCKTGYDYV